MSSKSSNTDKTPAAEKPAPSSTPTEQVPAAEKPADPPAPAASPPPSAAPTQEQLDAALARAEEAEKRAVGAERELVDVRAELEGTKRTLQGAEAAITQMQKFMKGLGSDVLKAIPLTPSQIEEILAHDHQAAFEVLEEWKNGASKLIKGRVLRAHHYPAFRDYVRAGLKVTFVEQG